MYVLTGVYYRFHMGFGQFWKVMEIENAIYLDQGRRSKFFGGCTFEGPGFHKRA